MLEQRIKEKKAGHSYHQDSQPSNMTSKHCLALPQVSNPKNTYSTYYFLLYNMSIILYNHLSFFLAYQAMFNFSLVFILCYKIFFSEILHPTKSVRSW